MSLCVKHSLLIDNYFSALLCKHIQVTAPGIFLAWRIGRGGVVVGRQNPSRSSRCDRCDLRKPFTAFFFGFYHRRTDFCYIGSSGVIGFQEGEADQMSLASFRQYPLRKLPNRPHLPGASDAGTGAARAKRPPAVLQHRRLLLRKRRLNPQPL